MNCGYCSIHCDVILTILMLKHSLSTMLLLEIIKTEFDKIVSVILALNGTSIIVFLIINFF